MSTMRSYEGGRGCSTTVEGTLSNREVVGSTPAGSWLFPSSILRNVYLNGLLEEPCGFSFKNECLASPAAWFKTSLIGTAGVKQ